MLGSRLAPLALVGLLAACGGDPPPAPVAPLPALVPVKHVDWQPGDTSGVTIALAPPAAAPAPPEEHWYFESLSTDGKRALLRELDPRSRATFHVRVVEVESGKVVEEATLPELAKIPATTIGGKPTEIAELEWMLASPAFGRDLAKGSHLAASFPFGACGRLAAATKGAATAFDAGDWLYLADEQGHVVKRIAEEAAYDPRFTPDGKHLVFRRATGNVDGVFAKYELFAMPTDLSTPPRAIPNTAGMRDRFVMTPDGQSAIAVAAQPRAGRGIPETCVVSLALKPPFAVKRLACLEGSEQLVESVVSPKGKWAAISTKKHAEGEGAQRGGLSWRLRVVSLANGKVVRDEPDVPGLGVRAISDTGLLVQSGALGVIVHDVPAKKWRELDRGIDPGHRGFFRNDKELVYLAHGSVEVVDVSKD